MEFHPIANIFPLLIGAEYQELVEDIRQNGLIEPIWLYEGKILDGRNRYQACLDVGIEPAFCQWNGECGGPTGFVIAMNLHRRHLDSSQRAACSVVALPYLEAEAKKRQATNTGKLIQTYEQLVEKMPQADDRITKVRDQAASLFGTNGRYVQDAKKLAEQEPELFERVKAGELTIPKAKQQIYFSSETPEWYTPQHIIDRVLRVMGEIDLDPCSNDKDNPNVPAKQYHTQEDDGLSFEWRGRIYMNPPYGREISDWVNHLIKEWDAGRITEAIALVPARTDTVWFRWLRRFPRCFVWGRLKFSESENSAPFPSMVVYWGQNLSAFIEAFGDIGDIYQMVKYDIGSK